jgi:2,4-dienoyl-CoA reductase-like NADH-dependent reductase (Old Yellow Enzyme family)
MTKGIAEIQKSVPQIAVVGTGYTYLRQFSPYLAAGSLESKDVTLVGYGREAFAYPNYAKDILQNGYMQKEKCCIACGKCTEIMRAGGTAGCVIKDSEIYAKIYRRLCL